MWDNRAHTYEEQYGGFNGKSISRFNFRNAMPKTSQFFYATEWIT